MTGSNRHATPKKVDPLTCHTFDQANNCKRCREPLWKVRDNKITACISWQRAIGNAAIQRISKP